MRAQCLGRLIDTRSRKCVAGYGWLRERKNHAGVFWVSIESDPYLFFNSQNEAKDFFRSAVARLRSREDEKIPKRTQKTLTVLASV